MTQSEIVILGLLYHRDMYGYELEQVIEEKQLRHWTEIGFSSIYSVLKKLCKKDMIDYRYEKEYGSPKRKVYYICEDPTNHVKEILLGKVALPDMNYDDFCVGYVFSQAFDDEEIKESLLAYRARPMKSIAHLEYKIVLIKGKRVAASIFRRHIVMIQAEIKWLDELLETTYSA